MLVFSDNNKNTSTYSGLFVHLGERMILVFLTKLAEYNYFPIKDNDVWPSAAINTTQINTTQTSAQLKYLEKLTKKH